MFYISILQLAPCFLLLLHRNGATWESQEGAAPALMRPAPRAPTAGLVLPQFLPSILKKHYSIFTSKSWMIWFVSLEPSIKEATLFLLSLLTSIYRSGYLTAEQRTGWPGRVDLWMHAFRPHIATKMECGNMLCTSDWEMTKKSRSKGWYIIYIYQCYYS